MREFVAGLALGAAVVGIAWWATSSPRQSPEAAPAPAKPPASAPRPEPTPPRPVARRRTEPAPERVEAAADAPFPPGVAVLRVGEGYVFGETAARPRGASDDADLVCQEIADFVSLRCPSGVDRPDLAVGALGLPASPEALAALVADAPEVLIPGDVNLLKEGGSKSRDLVALVKAASGKAYKVFVLGIDDAKSALDRRVRLGWAEVPQRKGGGVIAAVSASSAAGAPTLADLDKIVAAGQALPGNTFSNFLNANDSYERLSSWPAELVLKERKCLLADEPLATSVEFNGYSSLVAARGIASTGRVNIRSYTGVAVRGEMAGEIEANSYSFIHVSGNVTGKLHIRSYAKVVIDGDLLGEVEIGSSTSFLLRGRLVGKLTIRSGGSHFWFQQYMGRVAVEALGAGDYGNDLHLRESDYANGKHDDVPGWKTVVVGEESWGVIAR